MFRLLLIFSLISFSLQVCPQGKKPYPSVGGRCPETMKMVAGVCCQLDGPCPGNIPGSPTVGGMCPEGMFKVEDVCCNRHIEL